uniref:EOG090X07PL n=1 Tax=Lynceus sp. MCZ IZ 141354 TaxID=1930659 RepID=A0A9N6ZEL7_9CRUS|nr:EOG090X07PL [Lynceus sp. MCZ IZ 141354]
MEYNVGNVDVVEGNTATKITAMFKTELQNTFGHCGTLFQKSAATSQDFSLVIYETGLNHLVTLRIHSSGLILLNIELPSLEFSYEKAKQLEIQLRKQLGCSHSKCICPVKRGGPLDSYRYLTTSDGRLLEYDVDKVVADVESQFQRINIVHTPSFGNLLVLDDLQNLAESDLPYTEALMQRGVLDYAGKEVLILGGGDGGLLHELLKENPKMVTMVEIDKTVMELCRTHLRTACGDALDSFTGPHHNIILGDCLNELTRFAEEGAHFDFIFSDLTDMPLSSSPEPTHRQQWELLKSVVLHSLSILQPDGRFLTHGSGTSSLSALAEFESFLSELKIPEVSFSRSQAFVPSFLEEWVFYQVWLKKV